LQAGKGNQYAAGFVDIGRPMYLVDAREREGFQYDPENQRYWIREDNFQGEQSDKGRNESAIR
jgi:hypothetical protein